MQENIMLIAPAVESNTQLLGNGVYITAPWVMSERRSCDFIDGTISLHNCKTEKSYIRGKILEVINIGPTDSNKNRVAFVFKRQKGSISPQLVRSRSSFVSETREQVRY